MNNLGQVNILKIIVCVCQSKHDKYEIKGSSAHCNIRKHASRKKTHIKLVFILLSTYSMCCSAARLNNTLLLIKCIVILAVVRNSWCQISVVNPN